MNHTIIRNSTIVLRTVACVACARLRMLPARVTRAGMVCPSNTTTGATVWQAIH